jgi:TonB family protein
MSHVEPRFPVLALGPTGRVVLQLYVDEAGSVDTVAVESGDPTGGFEASAREAFAAARFLPGMKDGVQVKALVRIEVLFGSPHPDNAQR